MTTTVVPYLCVRVQLPRLISANGRSAQTRGDAFDRAQRSRKLVTPRSGSTARESCLADEFPEMRLL